MQRGWLVKKKIKYINIFKLEHTLTHFDDGGGESCEIRWIRISSERFYLVEIVFVI